VLIALIVGALVAFGAMVTAWNSMGRVVPQHDFTRFRLHELDRGVLQIIAQTGAPPASLGELEEVRRESYRVERSVPLDGWDRPFIYTHTAQNFLIVSYGRDGRPGGEGLDYDLSTAQIDGRNKDMRENVFYIGDLPAEAWPSFADFVKSVPTEERSSARLSGCVTAGLLAAALTLFLNWRERGEPSWPKTVVTAVGLVVLVVASTLTAGFMAAIHSSGH